MLYDCTLMEKNNNKKKTFALNTCLELNSWAGMPKKKRKFYWENREKALKLV